MKFSVSNIAWTPHDDPSVLALLEKYGVEGVELAPGKVWPGLEGASLGKAREYKKFMDDQNLAVSAMQSLLFGSPGLQVFAPSSHREFFDHIRRLAGLAEGLGCGILVFGAPGNRKRGTLSYDKAMDLAADFFRRIGDICRDSGCTMGMEPNPVEYGCDFVTNVSDAVELAKRVDHPSFKLHLDSGGICMGGGGLGETVRGAEDFIHYHISEPMLAPVCHDTVNQRVGIEALKSVDYDGWVSMEMGEPASVDLLERSLRHVRNMLED